MQVLDCCQGHSQLPTRDDSLEHRPSRQSLLDSPGQSAHSYGSVSDGATLPAGGPVTGLRCATPRLPRYRVRGRDPHRVVTCGSRTACPPASSAHADAVCSGSRRSRAVGYRAREARHGGRTRVGTQHCQDLGAGQVASRKLRRRRPARSRLWLHTRGCRPVPPGGADAGAIRQALQLASRLAATEEQMRRNLTRLAEQDGITIETRPAKLSRLVGQYVPSSAAWRALCSQRWRSSRRRLRLLALWPAGNRHR